jgi:hypothetical protein
LQPQDTPFSFSRKNPAAVPAHPQLSKVSHPSIIRTNIHLPHITLHTYKKFTHMSNTAEDSTDPSSHKKNPTDPITRIAYAMAREVHLLECLVDDDELDRDTRLMALSALRTLDWMMANCPMDNETPAILCKEKVLRM